MAYSKVHRGGFGCRAEWRACRRTDSKQRGRPRESGALVRARLDRILSAGWRPFFSRRRPPGRRIGRKRFALVPAGDACGQRWKALGRRLGRLGRGRLRRRQRWGRQRIWWIWRRRKRRRRRFRRLVALEERNGCEMLSTETKLRELVNRLKEFAAANLECVILFGSAARGDFHEGHSDLNVVCILRSLSVEELGRLAPVVQWWCVEQKEPAALFFTKDELRDAANVFAIEILDMKHVRRILY